MTNYDFNVDHSNPQERKTIYGFGKEMIFNIKQKRRKTIKSKTLIRKLKSPAKMASGVSTMFFSSDFNELCDRLKLFLQDIQAGINSKLINEKIVAIIDKLLEYKCISKKQHKQVSNKCNLLHTKKK